MKNTPHMPARYEEDPGGQLVMIEPPYPAPELLTEEEAIRFLRIDTVKDTDSSNTMERYRQSGRLRPTRISRKLFYTTEELQRFIGLQTTTLSS